jgi:hypothetical protein
MLKKSSVSKADSPFVKGAWVRCYAPRFFGHALAHKGQECRLRLAQNGKVGECASHRMVRWGKRDNNKVGVFAYAKDFSTTVEMTEGEERF